MKRRRSTPEEVILRFSYPEIIELLADLGMNANFETAFRLKQLVRSSGDFEKAIEAIGGTASMRRAG